jgi:hypothetical protein
MRSAASSALREQAGRPVYVLGAGFSKAISSLMPVTDELGQHLEERLRGRIDFDLRPGQSFEDWLTLMSTPMPFLEGHVNNRRLADADLVIAEIAAVLDGYVTEATMSSAPKWLLQLISLWDAEKAQVLTFNYDTLIERAVNTEMPVSRVSHGFMGRVQGDYVVFPAPPAPASELVGDEGTVHTTESFQMLKLHGSLDWYWASGDLRGTTLVRVRERHIFGSQTPFHPDVDFSGTTTLDRYLIPPITSKDGYYGSYLANTLWRRAREVIGCATSLTILGYSLPLEDRAASQLIAQVSETTHVQVVDVDPGTVEPPRGVLGRLMSLGIEAISSGSGAASIESFVESKVRSAILELPASEALAELDGSDLAIIVVIAQKWSSEHRAISYTPVWNQAAGVFQLHRLDPNIHLGSGHTPREAISHHLPVGQTAEDVVTSSTLVGLVADGDPFVFQLPNSSDRMVAISAGRIYGQAWDSIELKWAWA